MMRILVMLLVLLASGSVLAADPPAEQTPNPAEKKDPPPQPRIRPDDLASSLPTLAKTTYSSGRQEFVEVSAKAYPGLDLQIPDLSKRLNFAPRPLPKPAHDNRYYQNGGQILAFWGIPMRSSGELVSTGVPTPQ
jgi:hypothetical protein